MLPHKISSWIIIIIGMGATVWTTGFIMNAQERYALEDFYRQIFYIAAFIFFIIATLAIGRLTKWWDKK